MSWHVIIRPNAEADAREARLWYEARRTCLGDELLAEIRDAVRVLEEHPERRPIYYRGFRRLLTRRFPYYYSARSQVELLVGVGTARPHRVLVLGSGRLHPGRCSRKKRDL